MDLYNIIPTVTAMAMPTLQQAYDLHRISKFSSLFVINGHVVEKNIKMSPTFLSSLIFQSFFPLAASNDEDEREERYSVPP